MPVTKSAKRALRASVKKQKVNQLAVSRLEVAIRKAKRSKTADAILEAISLSDRVAKKKVIHKNKAARIKSQLSKLTSVKPVRRASPKKKKQSKKK